MKCMGNLLSVVTADKGICSDVDAYERPWSASERAHFSTVCIFSSDKLLYLTFITLTCLSIWHGKRQRSTVRAALRYKNRKSGSSPRRIKAHKKNCQLSKKVKMRCKCSNHPQIFKVCEYSQQLETASQHRSTVCPRTKIHTWEKGKDPLCRSSTQQGNQLAGMDQAHSKIVSLQEGSKFQEVVNSQE